MGRTALPPPVGDVKVDLDWPGYPLVAVLRDGQSQCHLVKTEDETLGSPSENRGSDTSP